MVLKRLNSVLCICTSGTIWGCCIAAMDCKLSWIWNSEEAMANANDNSDPLGFIDRDSLEGYQLERIAIVNRGEAAIRLIRAVRELNYERHLRLATVALYTEPDRQALFVHEADDAVCIGPATFIHCSRIRLRPRLITTGAPECFRSCIRS